MSQAAAATQQSLLAPSSIYKARAPEGRERAAQWVLWSIEGIGFKRFARILDLCGDVHALFDDQTLAARVTAKLGLGARLVERVRGALEVDPEAAYAAELARFGAHDYLLHILDDGYPPALRELEDPPLFVYVRGAKHVPLLPERIAMVGSREIPMAQEESARKLATHVAAQGAVIVSGGARGMDRAAHLGALNAHQPTVAVLPNGLGHLTPRRNVPLFDKIAASGGALITEYPWEIKARRYHFPRRNRLIAALAQGVVVLKARNTGGTMLTVEAAQQLGRPLAALPYEADDDAAAGSHRLIRTGAATMVCDAQDILATCLGVLPEPPRQRDEERASEEARRDEEPLALDDEVMVVWQEFRGATGRVELDALVARSDQSPAQVLSALTTLELEGLVRRLPGGASFERI